MSLFVLTVSLSALGLPVVANNVVAIAKKRILTTDSYPPINNLYEVKKLTNASGIATASLDPDDATVYHEVKIYDLLGVMIYSRVFTMPPQAVVLTALPVQDIITDSAAAAVASAATATEQAVISTAQAVIATDKAVLTASDRVQTGLDRVQTGLDRVQTGLDRVQTGLDRVQTGLDVISANSARDAALIQAGVYTTEALGRAAVANGAAFKVQGSGDVAAHEYRRVDASSSTLIATYPSSAAVTKKAAAVLGKNLFDITASDIAIGFFPNNSTGNLQANASYNTTGFIAITPSTAYVVSVKHYWVWYDSNKTYISGTSDGNTSQTQTAPSNAAYMRCSFLAGTNWTNGQVELGTVSTAYQAYGYYLSASAVAIGTINGNAITTNTLSGATIIAATLSGAALVAGTVSGSALAEKTVTTSKVNFLAPIKNLFDKTTITAGQYLSAAGVFTVASGFCVSGFIPVTVGTSYISSGSVMRFTTYYDSAQVLVAGGSNVTSTTFTVPSGVAYVRVTVQGASGENTFQLEAGSSATSYAAYSLELITPSITVVATPKDLSVTEAKIVTAAVTPFKTSFFQLGLNIYNYLSITTGAFLSPAGLVTTASGFSYSDYIAVTPSTQYVVSGKQARFTTYFDVNKTVVSGGSSVAVSTFTPPSGAVYVRITIEGGGENTVQVEAGSVATAFQPFGYSLQSADGVPIYPTQDKRGSASSTLWSGKTWASLGDSITAANGWQPAVATFLGLTHTNFGVSGTTLSGSSGSATAICQDARINAIATTFDLISVLAGTNDWAQSVAMGAASSTDPLTFNGALNTLLTKLSTRFPTKRIVLLTTTYGEWSGGPGAGWANTTVNNVGLTSLDYAEAVRAACKRWGTPCIDLSQCGWNTTNLATYIADGLHPNTTGYRRMSEVVIGGLKAITPLV